MTQHWKKLSPSEFQQLQDYAAYSTKELKDVVNEFHTNPEYSQYIVDGNVDFEGFKVFLNMYLEADTPNELCQHLFLSFVKRPAGFHPATSNSSISSFNTISDGKAIKEMAMKSSTAAVAAIAPNNAGSLTNLGVHSTTPTNTAMVTSKSDILLSSTTISTSTTSGYYSQEGKFTSNPGSLSTAHHPFEGHPHMSKTDLVSYKSRPVDKLIHPMVQLTIDEEVALESSQVNNNPGKNPEKPISNCRKAEGGRDGGTVRPQTNSVPSARKVPSQSEKAEEVDEESKDKNQDVAGVRILFKDVICYLSLIEGGRPEDKLEFMFRLYDTDGNGVLDTDELDCIVDQMMSVAEYLGWDITELKPILQDMMMEIDYDSDGTVSLEEWKRGGMTTIPLLVLLGLDHQGVKEDGTHFWRLKHFNRPAYCNLCLTMLTGVGKKGLCCVWCKYTVHERCVQRSPTNCIQTYVKSKSQQVLTHHWVEGNCHGKCSLCKKTIKSYNGISGLHCRWCRMMIHNCCSAQVKPECSLGELRPHILPPTSIFPIVLDRQRSFSRDSRSISGLSRSDPGNRAVENGKEQVEAGASGQSQTGGPMSFQICPLPNTKPLLVFINPKSGGNQGIKLYRKFQYLLNPRQVYNITSGGPSKALNMFKDVPDLRVICCGGDGTVGWLLDSMDKIKYGEQPAVGVIPLGTGNDLARCLKWGGGYEGESLIKILKKIEKSSTIMLDRWEISVTDLEVPVEDDDDRLGDPMPYNIINNYFSVGVDAAICVKFHLEREKHPHKFNSRVRNKMWYFEFGMTEQITSSCKNLHQLIEIECDGVPLDLRQGSSLQGLALLNIPYIYGGTNMWGDQLSRRRAKRLRMMRRNEPPSPTANLSTAVQDIGDGLIEIIGLENCLHMGQVRTGLRASGKRLAQCSTIVMTTKKRLPMQIDGEPWMQSPCTIRISRKNQVPMLMGPSTSGMFGFFKKQS